MNKEEILQDFAKVWETLNPELIIKHLDDSFVYDSQWVLESLDCEGHKDYITSKFNTVRKNNCGPEVAIVEDPYNVLDMIELRQNGGLCYYRIRIKDGKVIKGDMCMFLDAMTDGQYGDLSETKRVCSMDANAFKDLYTIGVSNEYVLNNYITFENYTLPSQMNKWLVFDKRKISGNNVIMQNYVKLEDGNKDWSNDQFKSYISEMFSDKENPELKYISLCFKCRRNLEIIYTDKEAEV